MKALALSTLAALAVSAPAIAQTFAAAETPVVTVVRVPKPWYAPKFLVASRMRDSIAEYDKLPGLNFKVYTIAQADGRYGGIYLWKDRASAQAWFNPAWFARVEKERGAPGEVRYFNVLKVTDNTPGGTPATARSEAVVALVIVPAGGDAVARAAQLRATLAADAGGLLREYTVTGDGTVGVVLLWRDQTAGEQGLSDAWRARARQGFGADIAVEWYDAPILLPSSLPANAPATN